MLRRTFCAVLLAAASLGCAEPPSKEMNQAQGAIDAARAAGAAQYASDELRAAVDALQQSEQAVAQNDYRLALSLAIDSRERANDAAKAAVEGRAKARGDAERVVAVVSVQLTQVRERLKAAEATRVPRRTIDAATQALASAEQSMQEASAALAKDDYAQAVQLASAVSARIQEALTTLDAAPPAPAQPRRR